MPPNNPRIIPPDESLLGGTLDNRRPILNDGFGLPDPYREGSRTEDSPVGPVEAPLTSGRRLTIYYQAQGSSDSFIQNTPPVVPEIDKGIDIAKPIINQLAQYANDRSKVNSIPIVGMPVKKVGFEKIEDPQQKKYTDALPEVAKVEFNTNPTIVNGLDTNLIDTTVITPDPLGIYNYDRKAPRKFRLNDYQNGINTGPTGNQEHKSNVDRMLFQTRGHNETNKFVSSTTTQNKKDGEITLGSYFYKSFGNYATGSYVKTVAENQTDVPPMTIEQLKNIGANIMFEAAQGQAGFDFVVKSNDPASNVQAEARMLLPSEQRLGKRVSLGRFTPAYQIEKISNIKKPNNPNFIETTDDVQSYGSFYNVYNQFDALVSLGQIALAVALILAFVLLLSGVATILQLQSAPNKYNSLNEEEKQRIRGSSVLQQNPVYPSVNIGAGDFFTQLLGTARTFDNTKHTWTQCLTAGIQEFFGFALRANTGTAVGTQAINSSLKVLTESGRLNVILREILRSGITLVENTASNPEQLGSVAGASNLIRKIRDLKIVRFINVLLTIGDKVRFEGDLHQSAQLNRTVGGGSFGASGSISYVDSLPDNRSFYISKSRLSDGRGLAWGNKTAGMQMLPLFVEGNEKAFGKAGLFSTYDVSGSIIAENTHWSDMGLTVRGMGDGYEGIVSYDEEQLSRERSKYKAVENDRLPATVVKKVEEALEADYMPFYIQDLRTNEILGFHAFLEDVNEDFNIEYSAQDGYGRMDKVQIYKGTTRNVSVNFKMMATNQDDHDVMWYKINRLAMAIYPQWTQGRKVSIGEHINFIQPFSQIPGATPVIRLRLGDLYKSNYSKMAVARLFGITTLEDYSVSGMLNSEKVSSTASAANNGNGSDPRISNLRNLNLSFSIDGNSIPNPRRQRRAANSQQTIKPEDALSGGGEIVLYNTNDFDFEIFLANEASQIFGSETNINERQRLVGNFLGRSTDNNSIRVRITKFIPDITAGKNVINLPVPVILTIRISELNTPRVLDREKTAQSLEINNASIAAQQQASQQGERLNLLNPSSFYDETKNPIMKAFNSSGGKGLAGVITSFKVDYGEAKGSWGLEGEPEYLRAPMFVTIQITMAVIHDITPGLDARGIMNAPIWPVGKRSNFFMNNGENQQGNASAAPASGQPAGKGYTANQNYFQNLRYINRKG